VAAVLEALIADPGIFPADLQVRAGLYRLLVKNWNSVPINAKAPQERVSLDPSPDRRLTSLSARSRQAFLLVAVEGFTPGDSASILDVPPQEFSSLLDLAGREIAQQVATEILIIEDEPLIALELEAIVTSIGHRVRRVARTKREAIAAFKAVKPGLILADIQLADGSSGLDAVNEILGTSELPVIFVTAFPEQLLTGLRPEPTFLIPKPFQTETIKAVVSQALFFDMNAHRAH
jgi:CheY-like chemotaxis protein